MKITNEDQRAEVLYRILGESWGTEPPKADHMPPRWAEGAPLVELTIASSSSF